MYYINMYIERYMDFYILNNTQYYACIRIHIHTCSYTMYGVKTCPCWGQIFCHWAPLGKTHSGCKLLWLYLWSHVSRKEAGGLNSTGQQVMHDTDVFPDPSTWKGLTFMSNIRATGICWFKNRLDGQNTFKLHTHTKGFCVIFGFS